MTDEQAVMPALPKPLPKEVNCEGLIDERGIVYIGIASLQPNGLYHVLAQVEGCLCRVECRIAVTPKN